MRARADYGGIKSEHLVLLASTYPHYEQLLDTTENAQTKFKMKGCLVDEYDATTATWEPLVKRIKFLATTKSPRGQGFRTVAIATPPSPDGSSLVIADKIVASSVRELNDDFPAGKIIEALGNAVVTAGTVDLPSTALLAGDGQPQLRALEHATLCAIKLLAPDVLSTVKANYSTGSFTASQDKWSRPGTACATDPL